MFIYTGHVTARVGAGTPLTQLARVGFISTCWNPAPYWDPSCLAHFPQDSTELQAESIAERVPDASSTTSSLGGNRERGSTLSEPDNPSGDNLVVASDVVGAAEEGLHPCIDPPNPMSFVSCSPAYLSHGELGRLNEKLLASEALKLEDFHKPLEGESLGRKLPDAWAAFPVIGGPLSPRPTEIHEIVFQKQEEICNDGPFPEALLGGVRTKL